MCIADAWRPGDQGSGGDAVESVVLCAEVEGGEAEDEVARADGDVPAEAVENLLGGAVTTAWIFSSSASGMP